MLLYFGGVNRGVLSYLLARYTEQFRYLNWLFLTPFVFIRCVYETSL